jgi:hypothetical protein
MTIADIQITPPVLSLDQATRQGRFRVQVANQLGRDGRLEMSLIPVGDTKPDWLRVDDKFRQLALKKDEMAVFEVAVAVPSDAAPGTYGFKIRCADDLDPVNVWVDSEPRDFVVAALVAKPTPAARKKWMLIAAVGAVLIGGGIALAIALTDDGNAPKPDPQDNPPPRADACVEGAGSAPCGQCDGVLRCDGSCSKPNPPNLGQSCGSCGKVTCDGCKPATPANFGTACGRCGGKINCQGACVPDTPPDYGQVKEVLSTRAHFSNTEREFGRPCTPGHVYAGATVTGANMPCKLVNPGDKNNCRVRVSFGLKIVQNAACEITIKERRACDGS